MCGLVDAYESVFTVAGNGGKKKRKKNPITSALQVITLIKSTNVARHREASFTGLV